MLLRLLFLFGFLISANLAIDNENYSKEELAGLYVQKQLSNNLHTAFVCVPVKSQIGPDELVEKLDKANEEKQKALTENLSSAEAQKLTRNNELNVNEESVSKKTDDLNLANEIVKESNLKENDQLANTESKLNETIMESNKIDESLNKTEENPDNLPRSEDSTALPLGNVDLNDASTVQNDINLQSNDNKSLNQFSNAGLDKADNIDQNAQPIPRAVLAQNADGLNGRQTNGLVGSLFGKLHPTNIVNSITGKNRPDESLALVADEKSLENSFKQNLKEEAIKQKESNGNTAAAVAATVEKAAEDTKEQVDNQARLFETVNKENEPANKLENQNTASSTSTTTTTAASTTSTTTTASVSSSTQSPEQIKQDEKIFKEFFDSRNGAPMSTFELIKSKIGLGSSKASPPAESERSNQPSLLPQVIASSQPVVAPVAQKTSPIQPAVIAPAVLAPAIVAPPTNAQYLATPLPLLPTVDQSNYTQTTGQKNPAYLSYDEYMKNLQKANNQYLNAPKVYDKPATNYAAPPKNYAAPATNYVAPKLPAKVETAVDYKDDKKSDYTTIDKLKGNVNGPVEVPALKEYKDVPKKPIKIKDYVENDQASYRTNDFRLSNLTPFNRVPAFARYSKVVSSASNGISRLYPGYKAESLVPIYGMYRN